MSALEVIALDTATPQLRAPGAGDTYTFPRAVEMPLGTANGVLYLNGSKVATSGSALTFDGSTFGVTTNTLINNARELRWKNAAGVARPVLQIYSDDNLYIDSEDGAQIYRTLGTERMRLTSTGLGIGESNPSQRLHVKTSAAAIALFDSTEANGGYLTFSRSGTPKGYIGSSYHLLIPVGSNDDFCVRAANNLIFATGATERMRLDSSGNLGLGVTPSLGKLHVLQSSGTAVYATTAGGTGYGGAFWNTDGGTNKFVQCAGAGANGVFSAGVGASTYMLLDTSGNLGLGVTPSGWATGATAIQFDSYSALFESVVGRTSLAFNTRESASGSYNYLQAEFASMYQQVSGKHEWFIAPSGNAGDPISFTQAMTLDASGRLGVGATSPAEKLDVYGGASGTVTNAQVGNAATAFLLGVDSSNNCQLRTAQSVNMLFYTAATERARIPSAGGMVVGTAAIATTATDGFLYVPTCAGTPTGTPTTQTGTAPIVIDTTNHKLYFYSGGTWRDAGP